MSAWITALAMIAAPAQAGAIQAGATQPGATQPRAAQPGTADPQALVRSLYDHYTRNAAEVPMRAMFTPRLKAAWDEMESDAAGEEGRLGMDFWTDSQDAAIRAVDVTSLPVDGHPERQIVIARFVNMADRKTIRFYFEKAGARWFLDDARIQRGGGGGGDAASYDVLSVILKYGD